MDRQGQQSTWRLKNHWRLRIPNKYLAMQMPSNLLLVKAAASPLMRQSTFRWILIFLSMSPLSVSEDGGQSYIEAKKSKGHPSKIIILCKRFLTSCSHCYVQAQQTLKHIWYIIVSASHQCFITDEQHQNLDISDSSELDQHLTWSQDITAGEEQQGRTRTVNGDFAFFAYSKS